MNSSPASAIRPWTPGALRLTLLANALAAVLVTVAWYGAANEATLVDGAAWANLSALGLIVAAAGNVRLLVVGRARIGLQQRALRRHRLAGRAPAVATEHRLVALAGGRLYHRAGCRLVIGKPAEALVAIGSLEPCGWCRP
jgi:hypothetical protein